MGGPGHATGGTFVRQPRPAAAGRIDSTHQPLLDPAAHVVQPDPYLLERIAIADRDRVVLERLAAMIRDRLAYHRQLRAVTSAGRFSAMLVAAILEDEAPLRRDAATQSTLERLAASIDARIRRVYSAR